jgi:hypothetical protein
MMGAQVFNEQAGLSFSISTRFLRWILFRIPRHEHFSKLGATLCFHGTIDRVDSFPSQRKNAL